MLITIFSSLALSGGQEESLEKQQDLQSRNPEVSEQPTMHTSQLYKEINMPFESRLENLLLTFHRQTNKD